MEKVSSLSFFFPAYNEEANVELLVRSAIKLLPELALNWEIVPVDDGSTDATGAILSRLASEDPEHIRPVYHKENRGYGGAVISGFEHSRYDLVFFTDGDRQFDLDELPLLIEKAGEGDLVLGFRKNRRDPAIRSLYALLWGTLVRMLFGIKVRDINCAFKLVKREVIDNVNLTCSGAMVSAELIAKAHAQGFGYVEAGVTHYPRAAGRPTGANLKVIIRAFRELFDVYRQMFVRGK